MNYNKRNIKRKRLALRSKRERRLNAFFLICIRAFLLLVVALSVCGAGFLLGSSKGLIANLPVDVNLEPKYSATAIYDDAKEAVQYLSDYDSNRIILKSDEISEHLKNSFIAIEDERFYEHKGIDYRGIGRAFLTAIKTRHLSQGASTITQQLIKNNVFNVGGEKNLLAKVKRKIQEQYLALAVEKRYKKEEILTHYLNTINLGKGTLGIEAASKYYFGKSASELSLNECTVLSGITKNPSNLNPVDYPEDNNKRRLTILKKMLDLELISQEEYKEAKEDSQVYTRIQDYKEERQHTSTYSYFTDALIIQIVEDLQKNCGYTQAQAYQMIYRGGLKIYSTQNSKMQKIATDIINDSKNYPVATKYSLEYSLEVKHANGESESYTTSNVKKYFIDKNKDKKYSTIYTSKEKMNNAVSAFKKATLKEDDEILNEKLHYSLEPQLSYSLIDHSNGQIKVLIGGRGKKQDDLSLNRAYSVTQQPGSTFKIISTYAPALDTGGMTLATVFDDAPYNYDGGTPVHNYERKYFGLMGIRDAIIDSDNVIAVKTLTKITPSVGYNYLLNLGFTSLVQEDCDQPLALGGITEGVTNVQLTAAFASIANKGEYNKPYLYTQVLDSDGNVILENDSKPVRVMKETTSWLLTSAMQDVVKKGTGKEASLSSKMGVAGKTGTTSNNYDYWFSGFTPYYTASIWTGYDYNTDFGKGLDYHKEIWAKIMNKIIKENNQKIKGFDKCKNIVKIKICSKSGKLAVDKICDHDPQKTMIREEYFEKGTEPKETCDAHIAITFCKDSSKVATPYCPKENQYTKIYRKRPADSTGTTDDTPYCLNFNPKTNVCPTHTKEWSEEQERLKNAMLNPDGTPINPNNPNGANPAAPGTNGQAPVDLNKLTEDLKKILNNN